MEKSPFDSLFGITTTTATVEDEPPPAQLDPFKIPMKIVARVMNNCYLGDGTVHPGVLFLPAQEMILGNGNHNIKVEDTRFETTPRSLGSKEDVCKFNGQLYGGTILVPPYSCRRHRIVKRNNFREGTQI